MKIIRAQLKLAIAIESYNEIATGSNPSWIALKKAQDKINVAKRELQATKFGLR